MSPEGASQSRIAPPVGLPTSEVTFLFTDIEGSTQRREAHPEAIKAAVARHEQIVKDAIERYGRYVSKLIGDAFCAAFQVAPDAVAAARDAQEALAAEDLSSVDGLRVRMGLYSGRAEERDADYFGPTVNRAARLIGFADAELKELGYEREHARCWDYEKSLAALRAQLSDADIERLMAGGAALSEDRAIDEALNV
jgi:class 3 adenylate cyclase